MSNYAPVPSGNTFLSKLQQSQSVQHHTHPQGPASAPLTHTHAHIYSRTPWFLIYQSWHHSCVADVLPRGSDMESSTWGCSLWLKQRWGGYTFNGDTNQIFSLMLILKADDLIALLGKRSICVYGWDAWVGEKESERLKSHLKMSFKSFASYI